MTEAIEARPGRHAGVLDCLLERLDPEADASIEPGHLVELRPLPG